MVDIEPLFGPKIRITTALAFTVYVHIPIRKSGSEIQTQIVGYKALAVCYERSNKILCNLLLPTSIPIHAGIWVTLDPHLIICSPRLYCKPGNNLHNIMYSVWHLAILNLLTKLVKQKTFLKTDLTYKHTTIVWSI